MRLAHTAFGGLAAMAWLLLPTATEPAGSRPTTPLPDERLVTPVVGVRPARSDLADEPKAPPAPPPTGPRLATAGDREAARDDGETSGVDLILPVAAAGTAVVLAAYSLVRRRRRARLRTTPTGVFVPPAAPLPDLHRRARRLLVETDDSVRTSTEELRFAAARPGHTTTVAAPESAPPDQTETGPAAADLAGGAAEPPPAMPGDGDDSKPPGAVPADHAGTRPPPDGPPGHATTTEPPPNDPTGNADAEAPPGRAGAAPPPSGPADHSDAGPHRKSPTSQDAAEPPAPGPTALTAHPEGPAEAEPSGTISAEPVEPTPVESAPDGPVGGHPDGPTEAHPAEPAEAHPEEPAGAHPERSVETHPQELSGVRPGGAAGASPVGAIVLDPAQPFAETPAARDAVGPFVEALADARGELGLACRAGLRLDEGRGALPSDEARALLEEILTRCTTAQRRLDTATPAFDQLRALERDIAPALEHAESRFRELTGRTATAATTLTALRDGYTPAASLPVTGHVEQAKDRLVFATTELNRARQAAYPGDLPTAAVHLRAAEGAIHQADLFVTGVERLAAELAEAAATATAQQDAPPTDPLDALRRRGDWLLPARSAVAAAADFVTTHRGAVGAAARTRLSEAERHVADGHPQRAHTLAQEARQLAEQDVRAYGNPYGGPVGDGLAGALLGGIILGEPPDGTGRADLRGPACYGGTATRARRTAGGQF